MSRFHHLASLLRLSSGAAPDKGDAPRSLQALKQKKRPVVLPAVCFMVAIALVLIGLETWNRTHAYNNDLEEGRIAATNMARATAEHANASINLAAAILSGVVERVETDGTDADAYPRLHRHLIRRVEQGGGLQGLFVYDETGRWAASSLATTDPDANNADRAYFKYHQTHPDRTVRIGAPIRSRSAGVWILPVSRRLEHADGSFAGVALATLRLSHFQKYYDGFDLGRQGAVFLALDDGTLVTRRPFVESSIGMDIAKGPVFTLMRETGGDTGSAMRVARLDGVERLYVYRKLANYPLVVAAALSRDDIFAGWWAETWGAVGAMVATLILLGGVGWRLLRQVLIRDEMTRELQRLQTQLHASVSELNRLANTDALTGLKNRRYLSEQMAIEFARAAREQTSLALVMIDIDFFKRYNDLYGHPGGDGCLRLVSDTFVAVVQRPGDIIARFGGEEFAVLLPNTDAAGALAVAARLCETVAALRAPHAASERGIVTISAGTYAMVPDGSCTVADLLEAADRGLYAAKSAGRGRACAGMRRVEVRLRSVG